MNVLVAFEYSGVVRNAFSSLGWNAWSCDILPTESKGQHLQGNIEQLMYKVPFPFDHDTWDLIIMHPPCTALSLSGNKHYAGVTAPKFTSRLVSIEWTTIMWNTACKICQHVALENPANVLGNKIGKRTQEIQPWMFGHMEQKKTWLWLYNLPCLVITNNVFNEMMKLPKRVRERIHYLPPSETRGKERSLTYSGVADAMAKQWTSYIKTYAKSS